MTQNTLLPIVGNIPQLNPPIPGTQRQEFVEVAWKWSFDINDWSAAVNSLAVQYSAALIDTLNQTSTSASAAATSAAQAEVARQRAEAARDRAELVAAHPEIDDLISPDSEGKSLGVRNGVAGFVDPWGDQPLIFTAGQTAILQKRRLHLIDIRAGDVPGSFPLGVPGDWVMIAFLASTSGANRSILETQGGQKMSNSHEALVLSFQTPPFMMIFTANYGWVTA